MSTAADSRASSSSSLSSSTAVPATLLLSFFERATKDLTFLSLQDVCSKEESASSLSSLSPLSPLSSLSQFRILILQTQQSALSTVVAASEAEEAGTEDSTRTNHTIELQPPLPLLPAVQKQLQNMESHPDFSTLLEGPLQIMTMAARQALARLVLQQELKKKKKNQTQQHLTSPSPSLPLPLTRTAIFDFCGLCQAAVQLEPVKEFLMKSTTSTGSRRHHHHHRDEEQQQHNHPHLQLYDTQVPDNMIFPHERMHYIQKLYFQALGYHNADTANQQLQGIIEGDAELEQVFTDTMDQLREALAAATMRMQSEELNDFEQGGVTRVVSVSYSDSDNHRHHHHHHGGGVMVLPQTMDMVRSDSHQQQYLTDGTLVNSENMTAAEATDVVRMARDTAALEQTLLAQLLQMDSDERNATLEQARMAHDEFMVALSNLTTTAERVAYISSSSSSSSCSSSSISTTKRAAATGVSTETRQLLLMHRIWQGLLERNGGQPPKMASTRDQDY